MYVLKGSFCPPQLSVRQCCEKSLVPPLVQGEEARLQGGGGGVRRRRGAIKKQEKTETTTKHETSPSKSSQTSQAPRTSETKPNPGPVKPGQEPPQPGSGGHPGTTVLGSVLAKTTMTGPHRSDLAKVTVNSGTEALLARTLQSRNRQVTWQTGERRTVSGWLLIRARNINSHTLSASRTKPSRARPRPYLLTQPPNTRPPLPPPPGTLWTTPTATSRPACWGDRGGPRARTRRCGRRARWASCWFCWPCLCCRPASIASGGPLPACIGTTLGMTTTAWPVRHKGRVTARSSPYHNKY